MIVDVTELKHRRLQRLKGVRDKKVYIGPGIVSLDFTNSCNLKCQHCGIHSPSTPIRSEKPLFLAWGKFLELVADCVDLKVDQIHIAGKGEPTLHPSFQKMMEHLEKQPLSTRLYTNGTFPQDYCLDVIRGDQVVINFAAVDRQQYCQVYGADLFDRVVENIKRLVVLRDEQKPKFLIGISYIVNSINVGEKQKMHELASQLGVESVFFKDMAEHPNNQEVSLFETDVSKTDIKLLGCTNGWFYFLINLDGSASLCCHIQSMPHCQLKGRSLKDYWFSPAMMNLRLMGKRGYLQQMYKDCQTCPNGVSREGKTLFPEDKYTNL